MWGESRPSWDKHAEGGVSPVPKNTLEVLVRRIEQLPSLPTVVHELIEVCKDPNATMGMVEEVICTDQSLTARMLKLVNSAFFALTSRISTIHHAAVILGMDALRNTAIAVCTYECLSGCDDNPQFDRRAFWGHAVAVGILAKGLAQIAKYRKPDEAFVAGLLHDLGKIVLDKYFPSEFARALAMCRAKELPLTQCEEAVLGFDHCLVGAEVTRQWRFPQQLIDAIERHHDPTANDTLCAVVMLADAMAKAWKFGAGGDPLLHPISPAVWTQITVDGAALREVVENSRDEIIQVQALFSSDADEAPEQPPAPAERPEPAAVDAAGTRLVFVTNDEAPLHPLRVYLEESDFDVLAVRPDAPRIPEEAECLVVRMPDEESATRTRDELASKHPHLKSLPSLCVALPCLPDVVVNSLRGAMAATSAHN